jgi:hypothetical protein
MGAGTVFYSSIGDSEDTQREQASFRQNVSLGFAFPSLSYLSNRTASLLASRYSFIVGSVMHTPARRSNFLPAHLSIRPLITISGPPPTGFLIPYRLHADSEAQPVDPSADLPCRSSTSRSTIISRGNVAKYCVSANLRQSDSVF